MAMAVSLDLDRDNPEIKLIELGIDPFQNYVRSFIINISRHNLLMSPNDTLVYDCKSHFVQYV
jgi:hypothetical protein